MRCAAVSPGPYDVKSWSEAYLKGKLSGIEIDELISHLDNAEWNSLLQRRRRVVHGERVGAIMAKGNKSLHDVCELLAILIETRI